MGAWGIEFNECDGALDFLGNLEDCLDWDQVVAQIHAFAAEGYEDGEEAFAALEVVAAALGNGSSRLPENVTTWVVDYSSKAIVLRPTALIAVDKLAESELAELWGEADEGPEWLARVQDLKTRLQA